MSKYLTRVTFSLFLFTSYFAFAKFVPSASSGPAGDPQGEMTRGKLASAISTADGLLAFLGNDNASSWPEAWRPLCGTDAAGAALAAVTEVRTALADIRGNWDRLSVQTVSLKKGWNSFYVYVKDPAPAAAVIKPSDYAARLRSRVAAYFVNPDEANAKTCLDAIADLANAYVTIRKAIVASYQTSGLTTDWPVDDVYVYMGSKDAASQFSTDSNAEAEGSNPYLTWSAAAPDSINFSTFPVGRVYTCFSTAAGSRTVALLGTSVRAGSMTWHKTGGSDNPAEWNYLGIAISSSRIYAEKMMRNLDFTYSSLAKLTGTDPEMPSFTTSKEVASLTMADGETLIADATATSSWYPAPVCSPADGVTIAAGQTETSFQLKNSTAAAQVVTGTLHRTGNLVAALKGVTGVQIRRASGTDWQTWNFSETSTTNLVFADSLSAGETRTYRVRFRRSLWDALAREGAYSGDFRRTFSGVMRFRFGDSAACSYLSLAAASDNSAVVTPWPAGLWVGTFAFDKVSQVKGNQTIVHNVPAGGTMRVRGLVHVGPTEDESLCRLLHHVIIESVTSSNAVDGTFIETRLYAGRGKPDTGTGATITRLDSVAMDIDNPIVDGTGSITNGLTFVWTIKPEGRANPFHHPYHPDHDGLQWDFKTPAPSGDDMNNYRQGQVKPETWSIQNEVTLTPDAIDGMEIPETMTGTCTWSLGNVRRSVNGENIRATGRYSLTRVKSVGTLVWE